MAKKVVATLKVAGSGRDWAKVIRCVKSPKTGKIKRQSLSE
ncbi:DUF4295 domain-containing protein [Bacteroidia bacterium]|nr:DUF4295 domain-containing protein [Bacteroidia bacterium]